MIPTRRTQPYRAGTARMPGLALDAMLRGRQAGVPVNGADYNRQRLAGAQRGLQGLVQQRMVPRASADIRGTFRGHTIPMGPGADPRAAALHQLVLAALMQQRARALAHI